MTTHNDRTVEKMRLAVVLGCFGEYSGLQGQLCAFWTMVISHKLSIFVDFGRLEGFLARPDLHFMGVMCFVLASPSTTGSMCCIFGVLWALLSFLWSFIDPGTWVKTANRR